jgi:hypothetical protein
MPSLALVMQRPAAARDNLRLTIETDNFRLSMWRQWTLLTLRRPSAAGRPATKSTGSRRRWPSVPTSL